MNEAELTESIEREIAAAKESIRRAKAALTARQEKRARSYDSTVEGKLRTAERVLEEALDYTRTA